MNLHHRYLCDDYFCQVVDASQQILFFSTEDSHIGVLFASISPSAIKTVNEYFSSCDDASIKYMDIRDILKPLFYEHNIGHSISKRDSLLLFLDFRHNRFYLFNAGLSTVLILNSSRHLTELNDIFYFPEEADFEETKLFHYPIDDIRQIFVSSNSLGTLLYRKRYWDIYSQRDLVGYVKQLGENLLQTEYALSFALLNFEIAYNVELTRHYELLAKRDGIEEIENNLEELLNQFYDNRNTNAKTLLVINELLFNAYEHGALGISSEVKQQKMEEGVYDVYLKEREEKSSAVIDVWIRFFTNGVIQIMIDDHGQGFDFRSHFDPQFTLQKGALRGRGITMSRNMTSAVFFTRNGSQVTFFVRHRLEDIEPESSVQLSDEAILSKMSVLYVEDESMIQSVMVEVIKPTVKTIYLANNGKEGLELYNRHKPDLIISGVKMPHMDGLEMAQTIKKINPHIPIIITTAHNHEANLYRALDIGIDKFLSKPVELKHIRKTMHYFAKQLYIQQQAKQKPSDLDDILKLRSRQSYLEDQQLKAFEKQQKIIRDGSETLENLKTCVLYKPLEVLSGDIYGIAQINSDQVFLYIIDCMGKGLVASVSAVMSAAFINRSISKAIETDTFSFEKTLQDYCSYISEYLLDEECISFTMVALDEAKHSFQYAAHGMYPTILKDISSSQYELVSCSTPPFMKGDPVCAIKEVSLPELFAVVLYSDGACKLNKLDYDGLLALIHEHKSFKPVSETISAMFEEETLENSPKDDITILCINNYSKGEETPA